jgi:hypothetical protein
VRISGIGQIILRARDAAHMQEELSGLDEAETGGTDGVPSVARPARHPTERQFKVSISLHDPRSPWNASRMTGSSLSSASASRRLRPLRPRHRSHLATLVLLLVQTSRSRAAAEDLKVPDHLRVCEGHDHQSCGTWTFGGAEGTGRWDNGAVADLVVQQFDSAWIIIQRIESTDHRKAD